LHPGEILMLADEILMLAGQILMHSDEILMLAGQILMHPGEKLNAMGERFMAFRKPVESLVDAIQPVVSIAHEFVLTDYTCPMALSVEIPAEVRH
jgi:hypothetical protein